MIAHSVGVTEILWAIVPHKNLIAFHQSCTNSSYCILAEQIAKQKNIFSARDTEKVIAWRPDLVFTVSYSSPNFVAALRNAGIRTVDLGYFSSLEAIKKQILLLGKITGQEANASDLVKKMNRYQRDLQKIKLCPSFRVLSYSSFRTVAGKGSTFDELCQIIGLTNLAKRAGIIGFKTVEAEWILKQNPDIIVLSSRRLQQQIRHHPLLKEAVKNHRLIYLEPRYLSAISQFTIAAANRLAFLMAPFCAKK